MRTLEDEIKRAKLKFDESKSNFNFKLNWDLYLLGWLQQSWVFAKEEFDELKETIKNESN